MIVYESEESRKREGADLVRFENSLTKLSAAGIVVERQVYTGPGSISDCCEAYAEIQDIGEEALPITEYDGAVVYDRSYPDDQTLADFLDVPDGVLSVNKAQPPSINDVGPACDCGSTQAGGACKKE